MKCKAKNVNDDDCQAWAIHNSDFCFRHNKDTLPEALQASANGGKARKQYITFGKKMNIKRPEDIKLLMEKSINKLWTGEMASNNPAGALGYLAKIFLDAYEKSDLEQRLEKLEEKLEQLKV